MFFCWAKNLFCILKLGDWENFKFLGDLLYWRRLISFLGSVEGSFFHKAINDQSCKLKKSWWQSYLFHVCMLTFLTFGREFSVWELFVCSSASNSSKSFYFCLVVTPWKYEYCLIWVLNKSILFGRNSLKVSLLCDMYSENFFTIVQFGRKSLKISVLFDVWKSV